MPPLLSVLLAALVLACPLPLLAQAPAPGSFQRLPSGTEYQLFRKVNGHYAPRTLPAGPDPTFSSRQGKFLLAHLTYLTGRDSVLQSTRQQLQNKPVPLPLQPVTKKGGQEEALSLVLPGDSAVFRFAADSLFEGHPVPAALKRSGNVLVMRIVGVRMLDETQAMALQQQLQQVAQAELKRQMLAHTAEYRAKDDALIRQYIKAKGLNLAKPLPDGTWYLITRRGTGPLPKAGTKVTVRYCGMLLATDKEFDSSAKHGGTPFTFTLGRGQVIPGWDEGISALPQGSSAILLIPSSLAYGSGGSPPLIPANANLRFDVELIGSAARPAAQSLDWVHAKMKQSPAPKRPAVRKPAPKR